MWSLKIRSLSILNPSNTLPLLAFIVVDPIVISLFTNGITKMKFSWIGFKTIMIKTITISRHIYLQFLNFHRSFVHKYRG